LTPFLLLEGLQKAYQQALRGVNPGRDGEQRPINFFLGSLPPKDSRHPIESVYPYVMAKFLEGEDTIDQGNLTIDIYIGVKSEDTEGWKDVLHIMGIIRQRLQEYPTIDQRYVMQYPFKYAIFEAQPWPCWLGQITTKWMFAKPVIMEGQKAWGNYLPYDYPIGDE